MIGIVRDTADVVVVGASFAGLNFARVAAMNGLDTIVIERHPEVGKIIRTTGVFLEELVEEMLVPSRFLINRIDTVHLYSPSLKKCTIQGHTNRFFMTDTTGFIKWLAKQAEDAGARIIPDTKFLGYERTDKWLSVKMRSKQNEERIKARFLVGADGAQSKVAQESGLHRNQELIGGTEWIYDGIEVEQNAFHVFLCQDLAPGYIAWVAPHGDNVAIGTAGYFKQYKAEKSMEKHVERLRSIFDMTQARRVKRKGGLIPIDPPAKRAHNEHCLLLGDAAGVCGNLILDGIIPAMVTAAIAGRLVSQYLLEGRNNALALYEKEWRSHDKLGRWLGYEHILRKLYRKLQSEKDLEVVFDRINSKVGQEFLRDLLFKNHICEVGPKMILQSGWILVPAVLKSSLGKLLRRRQGHPSTESNQHEGKPVRPKQ